MLKTFKEYMSYIGGFRIGNLDSFQPMASLGDVPPKGQGGRDSRGVGLNSGSRGLPLKANYTGQAPGTMRPFLTAAKKIQDKNKKEKVKEDKEMEDFLDDLANNTPNEEQFEENKEYDLKDKALYMKLVRQAMSVMPGSQRQKQIKKEIERVQKRLGIKEDAKRIPKKPGQKDKSDKHSDLYTDEDPRGTIHGLGFTDGTKARQSVNKIKNSGRTHAHKIQAAIAMSQRAKVASQRAKDPQKKKDLGQAHKVYQRYIDTNKKDKD